MHLRCKLGDRSIWPAYLISFASWAKNGKTAADSHANMDITVTMRTCFWWGSSYIGLSQMPCIHQINITVLKYLLADAPFVYVIVFKYVLTWICCACIDGGYSCHSCWTQEGHCHFSCHVFVFPGFVHFRNIVIIYTYLTGSWGMLVHYI